MRSSVATKMTQGIQVLAKHEARLVDRHAHAQRKPRQIADGCSDEEDDGRPARDQPLAAVAPKLKCGRQVEGGHHCARCDQPMVEGVEVVAKIRRA